MEQPASLSRAILSIVSYPAVIALSLAIAVSLVDHGASPGLAATLSFVAALAATALLERLSPYDRAWSPSPATLTADGAYLALAAVMQRAVGVASSVAVALAVPWLVAPRAWASSAPWSAALVALLVSDLGKYAMHRLAHERAWWWRFHAAHHAPRTVYSLNGVRIHPVNLAWNLAFDAMVPLAFGLGGRSLAALVAVRVAASVLQHANVSMRVGPLRYVFSTPDLHRWHHDAHDGRSNYGSTLIVWDILFGTWSLPAGAPTAIGLAPGSEHPRAIAHELVWPWCVAERARCRLVRGYVPTEVAVGTNVTAR